MDTGVRLNINMPSSQYRDYQYKDRDGLMTISSLQWKSPYLERPSIYWNGTHGLTRVIPVSADAPLLHSTKSSADTVLTTTLNSCHFESIVREHKKNDIFIISQHWDGKGRKKSFLNEKRNCLFSMVNTMHDDLARASAARVISQAFWGPFY